MRFLVAGAILLAIGLSLTEYTRRSATSSPTSAEEPDEPAPKKSQLAPKLAKLLELASNPSDEPATPPDAALALLDTLKTDAAPIGGLTPVLSGAFTVRQLRAGFGYAIAAVDVGEGSALLRVEPGTPTKVLVTRAHRITALTLDASTLFFAEGGRVSTLSARGDGLATRAVFPNATVTSLAAFGDDLLLTVTPVGQESASGEGVVVRLDVAGELTVLASDQTHPRSVITDGKEAFWLADGLWRAALDGAFASRISDDATGPLALDGDALVVGAKDEVRRLSRAGGKAQVLAPFTASALVTSSGLTRIATDEPAARLFDVTAGAEPSLTTTLEGPVSALALGGTTLFAVSKDAAGATVLLAK